MVVPDVFQGKKFICLAITEAFAGSDVSGLQTYARKDGNEWVINGTKKYLFLAIISSSSYIQILFFLRWITNGMFADWFTTGCRTEVMLSFIVARLCSFVKLLVDRLHCYFNTSEGRGRDPTHKDRIFLHSW